MANDTNKMLRAVLNGQSAMKSELITKIESVERKLGGRIDGVENKIDKLDKKIDGVEKRLTKRIDTIGLAVANLEDDAPTIEEFDDLEKRVAKVEQKTTTAVSA